MLTELQCCGLRELSDLSQYHNSSYALMGIIEDAEANPGEWPFGVIIFTEASSGRYATRFAKFIETSRLGTIERIPTFYNPNSGHRVRMFVWTVDHKAVARWNRAEGIKR